MGSRLLIVFSFVFACVRLSDARLRNVGVPTHWGVKPQKPAVLEAEPAAEPEREHSSQSVQQTGSLQSNETQPTAEPLSWKFPDDPVDPVNKPPAAFRLPQRAVTNRVAVRCGESKVQVEVSQDLLGIGRLIRPEHITLGGCSATEVDDLSHVLVFESELHGCGSIVVMTEFAFIYAFALVYDPEVSGKSNIIRSQRAVVGVECHYLRKHGVSNSLPHPARMPYKDLAEAEEQPYFSLQLMTDDWRFERTSRKYALRDTIRMQASVMQSTRTPVRLLVQSCVATQGPDSTSESSRAFIKNSGCLGDRHTGSRFVPQSHPDKLQFQIKASSFGPQRMMYITCKLKAIPASSPVTIEHKACFFHMGWREVSGKHQFCPCCESTCGMRKIRSVDAETTGNEHYDCFCSLEEKREAELTLGPIVVE
uniref:Zona pellucida sperm-binding protein 3 n=1 Tax=Stegastes partitus TaxID=144197 RepID=A0A3B4ZZV2_9TELE